LLTIDVGRGRRVEDSTQVFEQLDQFVDHVVRIDKMFSRYLRRLLKLLHSFRRLIEPRFQSALGVEVGVIHRKVPAFQVIGVMPCTEQFDSTATQLGGLVLSRGFDRSPDLLQSWDTQAREGPMRRNVFQRRGIVPDCAPPADRPGAQFPRVLHIGTLETVEFAIPVERSCGGLRSYRQGPLRRGRSR